MSALRTAVIGVGYLGNFHAQKYAAIPDVEGVPIKYRDAAAQTGFCTDGVHVEVR